MSWHYKKHGNMFHLRRARQTSKNIKSEHFTHSRYNSNYSGNSRAYYHLINLVKRYRKSYKNPLYHLIKPFKGPYLLITCLWLAQKMLLFSVFLLSKQFALFNLVVSPFGLFALWIPLGETPQADGTWPGSHPVARKKALPWGTRPNLAKQLYRTCPAHPGR